MRMQGPVVPRFTVGEESSDPDWWCCNQLSALYLGANPCNASIMTRDEQITYPSLVE